MNKTGIFLVFVLFSLPGMMNAQFKQTGSSGQNVTSSMIRPPSASEWFGFFNPDNLFMRQSYSMSYATGGSQSLALGRYTNSMLYRFSDKVSAQVDLSLQHSPYSTLPKNLQNSLTGLYLDRAQINYRPAQNVLLQVSYRQIPWAYDGWYSPFGMMGTGLEVDEVK
ncbi:MAG: hypothetical protein NTV54_17005 [Ignavibacteriales bacterium]|nr:hypothetical protein [Ignavibacteriales bacterium]